MRNIYLVTGTFVAGKPEKVKAEVRDYVLDYTKFLSRLGSDTIASSTWAEDNGGITIDSESETTTQTTVWLSGGRHNETYLLENTIVTASGRTIKRALQVRVTELSTDLTDDYET